ncbi:TolC family protein [Rubrivirga sp.]|uniref:TolC family protein n=1 Tax=Rubrivirga sp. TaxID=1885344 RepID=UPI003B528899
MSRVLLVAVGAVVVSGCAAVRPQAAFDDVRATVVERADVRVTWRTGGAEDAAAEAAVDSLLADSLTVETAVQVALLHNRRLQATYEDLGVAQAALVQAGLLSNPVFGGRSLWALDESRAPDLGFTVALEFLDVFRTPLRRRVAQNEYQAARFRVAGAVLDLAARTRAAFVRAQADATGLAMQRRVVQNAEAGYTASALLRQAGNVPAVDVLAEQALYEQARLDLLVAEGQAAESREALVRLMGLSGPAAAIDLPGALAPVPAESPLAFVRAATEGGLPVAVVDVAAVERAAVETSLDLAAARADVEAMAQRLGLTNVESVLPDLEVGGEAERDDGEWKAGPEVEVVLPLFDQGQARRAAARAELRRRQALYYATAVDVRSAARTLAQRLATTRRAALHYQTAVLPLRAQLVQQTLLQYNAMQTGVFGVLQAQQQEAEATRRYVDALAAYWQARADLDLLVQGRMPNLDGGGLAVPSGGPAMRPADH